MSNVPSVTRPKKPKRQPGRLAYGTKASRHWIWQLRQKASKWNSALDHNALWSVGAWLLGAIANAIVFLAFKKDIATKIGLDLGWVLSNHLALVCLLGVAPALGGIKKALKLIEVQDDHSRAELMNKNIANVKRCGVEVSKVYAQVSAVDSLERERRIIDTVAAFVAIAFADVAGKEQEALKVLVARVVNGKLIDVVAVAPSGALQLSAPSELARSETTFSYCIKNRKIITIPDIALEIMKGKDSKFRLSSSNPDGGRGSLICYPIVGYTSNEVRYVVSIYSDLERSFDPANNKYYGLLMATYAAHILTAVHK